MPALLGLGVCLLSLPAGATPATVLVEIDPAAERVVDARSARRLVPLELADVSVPTARRAPVLFFRVVGGPGGTLRIELWDSGEYHGARTLSSAGENPQLVARRVALAAAELGRRLARKRSATQARDARLQKSREERERRARERTQDGPLALRSELAYAAVPGSLWLLGSRLTGELGLRGPLRLDVAAELSVGKLDAGSGPSLRTSFLGLGVGPAYRFALHRALDLDLAASAAAYVLQVPSAGSLDAVSDQHGSWTARASGGARFQVRLTRQVRASLGGELGALLRSVSYTTPAAEPLRLQGLWWGASLGVVITPP